MMLINILALLLLASLAASEIQLATFSNTAVAPPGSVSFVPTINATWPGNAPFSAEFLGTLIPVESGNYSFSFTANAGWGYFWLEDHLACVLHVLNPAYLPASIPLEADKAYFVRLHFYYSAVSAPSVTAQLQWSKSGSLSPIDPAQLSADVPAPQAKRLAMQRDLFRGWRSWAPKNMLAIVLLPEALQFVISICSIKQRACAESALVDYSNSIRVGPHAYDASYAQFYFAAYGANISISRSTNSNDDLFVLVEQVTAANWTDIRVLVDTSYGWQRAGSYSIFPPRNSSLPIVTANAFGLRSVNLFNSADGLSAVGFNTGDRSLGLDSIRSLISASRSIELKKYEAFKEVAEQKEISQTAVMWNVIFDPVEAGPVAPVTRAWGDPYVMFEWDNVFAAFMISIDARDWAYSMLIQVVKTRTIYGFVPNYVSGGRTTLDRTEPPVASSILFYIYEKYGDDWLIDLLFDDLFGWLDWFWRERRRAPLGLICLGTDPNPPVQSEGVDQMDGSRYESGLDNSPMYDGSFFDPATHQMELYDVAMSSLFVWESNHLARLAAATGRSAEETILRQRAQEIGGLIQSNLWDDSVGAFINKFSANASFYERMSPTSFYPLIAGLATDEQVSALVTRHLFNATRLCLHNLSAPAPVQAASECYWGIPSITADDPAFQPQGASYWRGRVWGPMAQLLWLSLAQYDHVDVARQARLLLVDNMAGLLRTSWYPDHHVCENYYPGQAGSCQDADRADCFYHWGALTGFISVLEKGYYGAHVRFT